MVKKILFLILNFIWFNAQLFAQEFEGTLTYKVDLEVLSNFKKMGITKENLVEKMKKENTWSDIQKVTYNKEGFYRVQLEANHKIWSIYRPDSNKIYTLQDSSDICIVKDASMDLEGRLTIQQQPAISLLDTLIKVNDKLCKVIRVKWKSGYYDYCFSDKFLPVNPIYYKYHVYDGWYEYLKISNCLPVQIIKVTSGMMKITYTLNDIEQKKIEINLFAVPPLVPDQPLIKLPNQRTMKIKK